MSDAINLPDDNPYPGGLDRITDTRFGNHLRCGFYNPDPAAADAVSAWLDPIHVDETLEHDGFVAAQIFKRNAFQYLLDPLTYLFMGIYEIAIDPASMVRGGGYTPLPGWGTIGGRTMYGAATGTSCTYTPQHERRVAAGMADSAARQSVALIFASPRPDQEASYVAWVQDVHIPDMLRQKGYVAAQRFARHPSEAAVAADTLPYSHMTLFEIEGDPEHAWRAAHEAVAAGEIRLPKGELARPANPASGYAYYMGNRTAIYSALTNRKVAPG